MLNLKVRLKQKWFWITLIPLVFLLIDQVSQFIATLSTLAAGEPLYNGTLMVLAIDIVGIVFAILALIGFPVDLTTSGYGDSERALDYETPAPNAKEVAEVESIIKGTD